MRAELQPANNEQPKAREGTRWSKVRNRLALVVFLFIIGISRAFLESCSRFSKSPERGCESMCAPLFLYRQVDILLLD
jgi:hypothetical protein